MLADREMVEQNADSLLDGAAETDVAFLVVGDPLRSVCKIVFAKLFCFSVLFCLYFSATTHTDLILRAVERSIPYKVRGRNNSS